MQPDLPKTEIVQVAQESNIDYVTKVIDALLTGKLDDPACDINKDGRVTVADLTAAMDMVLYPPIPEDGRFTVNGVSFNMIHVEGGPTTIGAKIDAAGAFTFEKPEHQVTLSSFLIGETPVTQELWQAVMGSNPSKYKGDLQRPVENVSWVDCQTFIAQLNALTGMSFRLPTEAEWEYAARGGQLRQGYMFAGSNNYEDVVWCSANSGGVTHPVKSLQPNELGIYDWSGVNQWCQDWWGRYNDFLDQTVDPTGPVTGSTKIYRGGCVLDGARYCRVTYRASENPNYKHDGRIGFRLAL